MSRLVSLSLQHFVIVFPESKLTLAGQAPEGGIHSTHSCRIVGPGADFSGPSLVETSTSHSSED